MKAKAENVDAYIADFPVGVQTLLKQIRSTIRSAAPLSKETISYAIPTYKLNGMLVHFAGYKSHIGFYPGADGITKFAAELAEYKTSKGAVQFPLDKQLPVGLISRIVKFRIKQNLEKTKK